MYSRKAVMSLMRDDIFQDVLHFDNAVFHTINVLFVSVTHRMTDPET